MGPVKRTQQQIHHSMVQRVQNKSTPKPFMQQRIIQADGRLKLNGRQSSNSNQKSNQAYRRQSNVSPTPNQIIYNTSTGNANAEMGTGRQYNPRGETEQSRDRFADIPASRNA